MSKFPFFQHLLAKLLIITLETKNTGLTVGGPKWGVGAKIPFIFANKISVLILIAALD